MRRRRSVSVEYSDKLLARGKAAFYLDYCLSKFLFLDISECLCVVGGDVKLLFTN